MTANRTSDRPDPELKKRGRGRPRVANALTPAQRAKRYRDNKRARQAAGASAASDTQPHNSPDAAPSAARTIEELLAEIVRLRLTLDAARGRINDLTGALELFVSARAKNKRISADQMKGLLALLALDNPVDDVFLRHNRKR